MKILKAMKWIFPWLLVVILKEDSISQVMPDDPPFGQLETPASGSTVTGAIPVTGWVIDDNGGITVKIYRSTLPEPGGSLIYIGDAVVLEGLKPDIIQTYPRPQYYGGGFTWEMLTNYLPNQGNGTYTLVVVATDAAGQSATLGEATIICDNANAVKPFGMIDTPVQGGIANGSQYINWGWALTPQPHMIATDGSTIDVFLDGVNIGHPNYGVYRADIAFYFPGFANTDSGVGYFYLDTTPYEDGLYNIWWEVEDNGANTIIIGNRYFYIYNGPEIQVKGGTALIANGDTIPSLTDGTAFVWTDTTTGDMTHTFTIRNQGSESLIMDSFENSVTVTGSAFSIGRKPADTISGKSESSFDITFHPDLVGLQKAIVSIQSNDTDENPYQFSIIGFGQSYADSMALVVLYNSTHGNAWTDHMNWLTGPLSTWFGVTVSSARVTEINLVNNHLEGPLPPEIGTITNLTKLMLKNNLLSGAIPSDIGNLTLLRYLYLNENQLQGSIPPEIGMLTQLYYLYLSDNQFSGAIPPEILNMGNLTYLYISRNQFTNLPDLSSLSQLITLSVDNNQFTFEDIEANINISGFFYSPQENIGTEQDTLIIEGTSLDLSVLCGGSANVYQWKKNEIPIDGANSSIYTINAVALSDSGSYSCQITNTIAEALTLFSEPFHVHVEEKTGLNGAVESIPGAYHIHQNIPNPFNSVTAIAYELPVDAHVSMVVYNIQGEKVRTLIDCEKPAGVYSVKWDGKDNLGHSLSSGLYFCKMSAEAYQNFIRMLVLK